MKRLAACLCMLVLLAAIYPAQATSTYVVANPHSSWVHLRQEPTTKSLSLGKYNNGSTVYVKRDNGDGWYLVEAGGQRGFMLASMLRRAGDEGRCVSVGRTSEGDHIMQYTADNGQQIYFTTIEPQPVVKMQDVNFDGQNDVVVFVAMGASNHFCEFFIFANGQYHQAWHDGIGNGLCNYTLLPELRIVQTQANNGYAGALHETCLFRWEGNDLKLIRRAVSKERMEAEHSGDRYTLHTHMDEVRVTVRDYSSGEYEGELMWEETVKLDGSEKKAFETEHQMLWQGIR